MAKPAISVLTPTYNRAHVLHRVYESLRRQAARDFEWVVVDDGSTDETPALLARWQAEADFPVTWCRYGNNRGRNAAVKVRAIRTPRQFHGRLTTNIWLDGSARRFPARRSHRQRSSPPLAP